MQGYSAAGTPNHDCKELEVIADGFGKKHFEVTDFSLVWSYSRAPDSNDWNTSTLAFAVEKLAQLYKKFTLVPWIVWKQILKCIKNTRNLLDYSLGSYKIDLRGYERITTGRVFQRPKGNKYL